MTCLFLVPQLYHLNLCSLLVIVINSYFYCIKYKTLNFSSLSILNGLVVIKTNTVTLSGLKIWYRLLNFLMNS